MGLLARDDQTICAIATPPGTGGIAVIRVSGESALEISKNVCLFLKGKRIQSHTVHYGTLRSADGNEEVDEVLVSYFASGKSFTGEETIEISCHGSQHIAGRILKELIVSGARLAEPGEFTYRAFMSGRIDLVQAEGVLELIESQSQRASQLALRQLKGEQSRELSEIENSLTWILAHLEANIDFAAEDIEVASTEVLKNRLQESLQSIDDILATYAIGKAITQGLHVALVGKPNAGKSSLLNALLDEDKAIVTDVAGTTRDIVEGEIWIEGYKIQLHDTAGLRAASDQIESLGIDKTKAAIEKMDLTLLVIDPEDDISSLEIEALKRPVEDESVAILFNKSDIVSNSIDYKKWIRDRFEKDIEFFVVSAVNRQGLDKLKGALLERMTRLIPDVGSAAISNSRHYELLRQSQDFAQRGFNLLVEAESPEFIAFELQSSLVAIQEILGKKFDDEVMDKVFSEFCLGK